MAKIDLWKDKATKKLDPRLFSDTAETLAREIGREKNINKSSQLRRYFDEVVRLNTKVKSDGASMDTILPQVHMLLSKVAYARGRNLVTADFVEMMKSGIYQVHDADDLHVFANFLESFMGYYKMYGPK